jgi:ABC-type transporter Mla maintaining outer membrane lipid asymmetry permease subunit MlaE
MGVADTYADSIKAEIAYRKAKAQIDAAQWMKVSAIWLGIAAMATALFQFLGWVWPNPLHH